MIGRCTHGCAILAALIIAIVMAMVGSAYAENLSDRHQKICGPHGGVNTYMNGEANTTNTRTCTAECFRYTLICRNNQKFTLTSRFSPYAGGDDIFFAEG